MIEGATGYRVTAGVGNTCACKTARSTRVVAVTRGNSATPDMRGSVGRCSICRWRLIDGQCPNGQCPGPHLTAKAPSLSRHGSSQQRFKSANPPSGWWLGGHRDRPTTKEPPMPKQQPTTSKPTIATLPGTGVSAKLSDFLAQPGPSAKPPTTAGKSTGSTPQNKRGNGGTKR